MTNNEREHMAETHQRGCLRRLVALGLAVALPACGPAVDLDSTDGSTGEVVPSTGSTGAPDPTAGPSPTTDTPDPDPNPDPDPDPDPTTGADETTRDTDGCAFLGCEETGGPVAIECDVFEQNCPDGEKCMPWANDGGLSWNATRCVPIDPDPAGLYEPCTVEGSGVSGIDSCDLGMICWDVDEDLNGTCWGMCGGSPANPTCEDANSTCTVGGDSILPLCVPNCDPLVVDSCDEGQGCYWIDPTFVCAADASGPKLGAAFDPCEFINSCDPGLVCAPSDAVGGCDGTGCCTPYCDLQQPVCPDPTSCIAFFAEGEAPPGYEDVGLCALE